MLQLRPLIGAAWETQPIHLTGAGRSIANTFGPSELEASVCSGDVPSEHIVVRGFLGPVPQSVWGDQRERLRELVWSEGHALVVNAAHRCIPVVRALAQAFEGQVGGHVRSNAYRTAQGTFAYPLHWDTHSLVVFQLAGKKRWELFRPVHERPLPGHVMENVAAPRVDEGPPDMTVEVEAGDLLYVPRGWAHRVSTTGEQSVHVTFGFHKWSRHDAISIAAQRALLRLEAREPARRHLQTDDRPEDLRQMLMALLDEELAHVTSAQAPAGLPSPPADAPPEAYRLIHQHLYMMPAPVRGKVFIRMGTPRQDEVVEHAVEPRTATVVEALLRGPKTLTELTDTTGLTTSDVESALGELNAQQLLRPRTPEDRSALDKK